MTPPGPPAPLLDEHLPVALSDGLRRRSVDARHVLEEGWGGLPDHRLLTRAHQEQRVLVTRNYRDFAILDEAFRREGKEHSGILFLPSSIPQGDVGIQVRTLERWIRRAEDRNPVRGTFAWTE